MRLAGELASARQANVSGMIAAFGALVDRIKVNNVSRQVWRGRPAWVKRRRWMALPILASANCFFEVIGHPVEVLRKARDWQKWEVDCFLSLHGESYAAESLGSDAIVAEAVPGQSLSAQLSAGTLGLGMIASAARELSRAHQQFSEFFDGPWSHGDSHTGNFIYDEEGDRARLIDFELRHRPAVAPEDRQADDLLVFLQDVVGRIDRQQWIPSAEVFLRSYGREKIIDRLRERLLFPRGIEGLWWAVRTTYLDRGELDRRLADLRATL